MAFDEPLEALPRLVGAPAYARPPVLVETAPRPFDLDELPLEVDQTEEERAFAAGLPARAYAPGGAGIRSGDAPADRGQARGETATSTDAGSRSLSLRRITRFRGGRSPI